ncbi:MAG: hypothetical protein QXV17_08460 [Candidatus Micrarchaeaceae archaeon]
MRILQNKNKTVLVATSTGCPRVSINKSTMKFADDYHGRIKVSKKLASMLF